MHKFLSNSQRYLQFEQCYDKRFHNKTMQTFDCTSDVLAACVVLTLFSAFNFVPRRFSLEREGHSTGNSPWGRDFFRFIEEIAFSFPGL